MKKAANKKSNAKYKEIVANKQELIKQMQKAIEILKDNNWVNEDKGLVDSFAECWRLQTSVNFMFENTLKAIQNAD